jgi:hypothetical protein
MGTLLEEISNHLEFFGYTIEKKEREEDESSFNYYASHEKHNNLRFFEINKDFVLLQMCFYKDELPTSALAETFNELNRRSVIAKFYYTINKDGSRIFIFIEATFIGDYTKKSFAIFWDMFKTDERTALESDAYKNCFITKKEPNHMVQ